MDSGLSKHRQQPPASIHAQHCYRHNKQLSRKTTGFSAADNSGGFDKTLVNVAVRAKSGSAQVKREVKHKLAHEADETLTFDIADTRKILDPKTHKCSGPEMASGDSSFRQVLYDWMGQMLCHCAVACMTVCLCRV